MMRFGSGKILSMLCVAVAALFVLVFAMIPHHHHGESVCLILEHCTQQEKSHGACDHVNHTNSCLSETKFVTSSDNQLKCKVSSCDNHDHAHIDHLLPLLCVLVDTIAGNSDTLSKEHEYREFVPIYKSAYVGLNQSLRAPPFSIC